MQTIAAITAAAVALGGIGASKLSACGGSTRPNCFQTVLLAKFTPAVVLFPAPGAAVTVPVGVVPFVTWNNVTAACAQPSGASISLTFTCTPVGGGAPIVVGPTVFPQATPVTPGVQLPGAPLMFAIPAGTLPGAGPYLCTIAGSYSVTFGAGIGAGTVTGMGDTEVCLVPPSPLDANLPRLNMRCLDATGMGFQTCRRGDQTINFYLIENNDANNSVTLDFSTLTNQVARMPQGDNAENTLFAISSPTAGTDNFPLSFDTGSMISLPDPLEVSDRAISQTFTLAPEELIIVPVAIRSFGMCADGSCGEVLAKVSGTFADGSPALGCAGTALLVGDVTAKTPLCEITDLLKTGDTTDTQWSAAIFDGSEFLSTHFAGNLFEDQGGPGVQTTGAALAERFNTVGFPPSATDTLRTDSPPTMATYSVDGFPQELNFTQQSNQVTINNLPPTGAIRVPLISSTTGNSDLRISLDAGNDNVSVVDNGSSETLFNGTLTQLIEAPPTGLVADPNTCREIQCSGIPSNPWLGTIPNSISELYTSSQMSDFLVDVINLQNQEKVDFSSVVDTDAVELPTSAGGPGDQLIIWPHVDRVETAPETTIARVTVTNDSALNSPLILFLALRASSRDSDGDGVIDIIDVLPQCGLCGATGIGLFPFIITAYSALIVRRRYAKRRINAPGKNK
jgi:hypothetical protein